ncbi:hypothetical protein [uncultured phage cr56_1]|uniref:Uncharacterized protein n=1 Tax=uncultured phage cr56_1 TaxID=2772081 RepID=A0A7M1RQX9_9CAUD|nr:hypothetical protein KNV48_gp41 [uncultured phage cr56_1]QOR56847.1 hypothetical protein [uncultured phage cr56_1]
MKSKRKIKGIKKYQYGGVDWQRLMTEQLLGVPNFSKYGPNVAQRASLGPTGNTSTPTNNINITDILGKGSDIIGGVTNIASMLAGPSTATTKGEAVQQSIQNVIGGAATGAQMGSVAGPVGAIVGGAAGLATGLVGKKGKISGGGFYEDPTLTLGTGIRGAIGNKGLKRRYEAAKTLAGQHRIGASIGAQAQLEWDEDYDQNVYTMESGGLIPSSMAYVDDGELINTPQGQILEIPEEGKPTDSNLVNLPEGSRVLSDTLKVPGSKETFAQMGKRLMSKKTSKAKDKYAENATMLNLMHDLMIYDRLFAIQEGTKKKQSVLKFADGGTKRGFRYRDELSGKEYFYGIGETFSYKGNKYRVNDRNLAVPIRDYSGFNTNMDPNKVLTPQYQISGLNINLPNVTPTIVDQVDNLSDLSGETVSRPNEVVIPKKSVKPRGTATTNSNVITPVENTLDLSGETQARVPYETAPYIFSTSSTSTPATSNPTVTSTPSNDWGSGIVNLFTDIAALAPTISNMYAKPESFNAVYNPYEAQINLTMANRRFDISPAKRAIRENRAISNYNAANYNPNTGANLAYRIQSQVAANKAISDLYSTASNVNNLYKADYASTLNSLGQQRVNATNMAVDMNARSRAAARNIQRTALSQLSQYAQNKQLMKNQKSRDMAMLEMYGPFLEAGYKASDFASFMKKFKKG